MLNCACATTASAALAASAAQVRARPSGSPGETDVMGSQMYPPLLDLELPASVLQQSPPAA